MRLIKKVIRELTRDSWDLSRFKEVASDQVNFVNTESFRIRWLVKLFKRKLFLRLLGQECRILHQIPSRSARVLWINLSATSIGDALMDLSGRRLLEGMNVDLLTARSCSQLFLDDDVFRVVHTDRRQAKQSHKRHPYDLFIVDSFSTRSVGCKAVIDRQAPMISMYGFINGFEIHRTEFSFARVSQIAPASNDPAKHVAKVPTLGSKFRNIQPPSRPRTGLIGIVVGGNWSHRRYSHWVDVIHGLGGPEGLVLLGSDNGAEDAKKIRAVFPDCNDYVGKCSLLETIRLIECCSIVLAADGGLWHVATALGKPTVLLFSAKTLFDSEGKHVSYVTGDMLCQSVYHPDMVDRIPPSEVVEAFVLLQKRNELGCNPPEIAQRDCSGTVFTRH
jgi:hypothetical protein